MSSPPSQNANVSFVTEHSGEYLSVTPVRSPDSKLNYSGPCNKDLIVISDTAVEKQEDEHQCMELLTCGSVDTDKKLQQMDKKNIAGVVEILAGEFIGSVPTTVVCSIDKDTGKYESVNILSSHSTDDNLQVVDDTDIVLNCVNEVKAEGLLLQTRDQTDSAPGDRDKSLIRKSDNLASPNLSDILDMNSVSDSAGIDSSAVNGGDEMEDSTSDQSSSLNATDDLITASIGLIKIDTPLKQRHDAESRSKGSLGNLMLEKSSSAKREKKKIQVSQSESDKENCPNDVSTEEGLDDTDGPVSAADISLIDMIENVDESSLHKSSISQFLNSRCSSRSRYLDDSTGSFYRSNISQSKSNLSNNGVEIYYPKGMPSQPSNDPHGNESNSYSYDTSDYSDVCSPSLRSFEQHEKGVQYLTKSRSGSRSSDYSSNGTMTLPDGSFQGHCQHRDLSLLGEFFSILNRWAQAFETYCGKRQINESPSMSPQYCMTDFNCGCIFLWFVSQNETTYFCTFLYPRIERSGAYCFTVVRMSVRLSV